MKINFRFRHVLPALLVLLTDRAFTEFVVADSDDPALGLYNYAITGFSLLLLALYFRYLSPIMRRWLLVVGFGIGALALESYNGWGTPFVYPHVFAKLLALLPIFALYAYYRRHPLPMGLLMFLLVVGLAGSLAVFHPDALSLSAFLETERGFNVTSAYLLMLPALYYFIQYLTRGGLLRLSVFFGLLALIVFLQHRTVWLTTGLALALTALLVLTRRLNGARLTMPRLMPLLVLPLLAIGLGGTALILDDPQVLRKLESNVEDITHADKQGTGNWRIKQMEAYEPFVEEYPVAGMRLEGFELPIQFYGDGDHPVWPDRTGHHFHSFYFDRLFYFGVLGVLLVIAVPIWQLLKRALQPVPLSAEAATLLCFSSCALLYGISYDWPPYLYGLIGLTMAVAAPVPVAARTPARSQPTMPPLLPTDSSALPLPA